MKHKPVITWDIEYLHEGETYTVNIIAKNEEKARNKFNIKFSTSEIVKCEKA